MKVLQLTQVAVDLAAQNSPFSAGATVVAVNNSAEEVTVQGSVDQAFTVPVTLVAEAPAATTVVAAAPVVPAAEATGPTPTVVPTGTTAPVVPAAIVTPTETATTLTTTAVVPTEPTAALLATVVVTAEPTTVVVTTERGTVTLTTLRTRRAVVTTVIATVLTTEVIAPEVVAAQFVGERGQCKGGEQASGVADHKRRGQRVVGQQLIPDVGDRPLPHLRGSVVSGLSVAGTGRTGSINGNVRGRTPVSGLMPMTVVGDGNVLLPHPPLETVAVQRVGGAIFSVV